MIAGTVAGRPVLWLWREDLPKRPPGFFRAAQFETAVGKRPVRMISRVSPALRAAAPDGAVAVVEVSE
jgi:hypothetical protein